MESASSVQAKHPCNIVHASGTTAGETFEISAVGLKVSTPVLIEAHARIEAHVFFTQEYVFSFKGHVVSCIQLPSSLYLCEIQYLPLTENAFVLLMRFLNQKKKAS